MATKIGFDLGELSGYDPTWFAHVVCAATGDAGGGVIDVLVLKNATGPLQLHIVCTCSTAGSLSLSVAGGKVAPCGTDGESSLVGDGTVTTEVMAAPLTAFNTVAEPTKVWALPGTATIAAGGLGVIVPLPAFSLTTVVLCTAK